ncbi:MAG: hypothetical protein KAR42_09065 [candidate division Zixibacteria bacterium]|nr:hypothetical protein [candidate division Zixibacteria bacterium]
MKKFNVIYYGLIAVLVFLLVVSCGKSTDPDNSGSQNTLMDTFTVEIIPTADTTHCQFIFDFSGIDGIQAGTIDDIEVSYFSSTVLQFAHHVRNIKTLLWVETNEAVSEFGYDGGFWSYYSMTKRGCAISDYITDSHQMFLRVDELLPCRLHLENRNVRVTVITPKE